MNGVVTVHKLMAPGKFTPLPGGVLDAGWATKIHLPAHARVCAVGTLKNMPVLWATGYDVNEDGGEFATEARPFLVVADGHPHESVHWSRYVGTILPEPTAGIAWHVFTDDRPGGVE